MTETSVFALIGAPAPVEDAVARLTPRLRRREPAPHPDVGQRAATESLCAPQHHPTRHHLDRRAAELAAEGAEAGEPDQLLTTSDVAEWLGISTQWLEIGRGKNYGPKFVVLSTRRVRYRRTDVLAWLTERTHSHTAEYLGAKCQSVAPAPVLLRRGPRAEAAGE